MDDGRLAELTPQAQHGHSHGVGPGVRVLVPHALHELFVRDDTAAGRHQRLQHGELLRGQLDRASGARHRAPGRIELDVAAAQGRRPGGSGPPGERPKPRDELGEVEGLGHVVVGSEREPVDEIVGAGGGGEHQHPAVGLLVAKGAADLVAV